MVRATAPGAVRGWAVGLVVLFVVVLLCSVPASAPTRLGTLVPASLGSHHGSGGAPRGFYPAAVSTHGRVGLSPGRASASTWGVRATIAVGHDPVSGAYDSASGNLYVSNTGSNNLSVISTSASKLVASVSVGFNPTGIVYDNTTQAIYVANSQQADVSVVNTTTNRLKATIPVGLQPVGVAFDGASNLIVVANEGSNNVSIISGLTRTVTANIAVGDEPIAAAFDPTTQSVYVANALSNNVTVIDLVTDTVVANIGVGTAPQGVAYDSANGDLYVTNLVSNTTSVINATTNAVVATISTGTYPTGIAYDNTTGVLFVAAELSNQSLVISGATNSIIAQVPVGTFPVGVAFEPVNGFAYVMNAASNNVSVVGPPGPPPYPVDFTEMGLPSGSPWSVVLNGTTGSSTNSTVAFSEPNGRYAFSVSQVVGYSVSPARGNVTVNDYPVTVAITYTEALYAVQFSETGLPNGTIWSVTLADAVTNTSLTHMLFDAPNGTYNYTVVGPSGYTASPASGSVTINGAGQSVSVTFSPGHTAPSPGSSSKSTSGWPLWVWIVLIVVIVAVVTAVVLLLRRRSSGRNPSPTGPPPESSTPPASPPPS